jgi:hypothetical protein
MKPSRVPSAAYTADVERALEVLHDETGQDASVAEVVPWGTRLAVGGDPVPPPQKAAREADLRRQCMRRLRQEDFFR